MILFSFFVFHFCFDFGILHKIDCDTYQKKNNMPAARFFKNFIFKEKSGFFLAEK